MTDRRNRTTPPASGAEDAGRRAGDLDAEQIIEGSAEHVNSFDAEKLAANLERHGFTETEIRKLVREESRRVEGRSAERRGAVGGVVPYRQPEGGQRPRHADRVEPDSLRGSELESRASVGDSSFSSHSGLLPVSLRSIINSAASPQFSILLPDGEPEGSTEDLTERIHGAIRYVQRRCREDECPGFLLARCLQSDPELKGCAGGVALDAVDYTLGETWDPEGPWQESTPRMNFVAVWPRVLKPLTYGLQGFGEAVALARRCEIQSDRWTGTRYERLRLLAASCILFQRSRRGAGALRDFDRKTGDQVLRPVPWGLSQREAARELGCSTRNAGKLIETLVGAGVLKLESTGFYAAGAEGNRPSTYTANESAFDIGHADDLPIAAEAGR